MAFTILSALLDAATLSTRLTGQSGTNATTGTFSNTSQSNAALAIFYESATRSYALLAPDHSQTFFPTDFRVSGATSSEQVSPNGQPARSLSSATKESLKKFHAPVAYFLGGVLGGTGLLIVVGVGLDTVQQMQQHLLLRHYEGFMKKGRVRFRGRQRYM